MTKQVTYGARTHERLPTEPNFGWHLLAWLIVLASFAPYFGLPLGASTAVSVVSILSVAAFAPVLRQPRALAWWLGLAILPIAGAGIAVLLGRELGNPAALVSWLLYILPALGFMGIVIRAPKSLIAPLRFALVANGVYALAQQAAMESGYLPLLGYYSLPGFASVSTQLETILTYVRRPFSLFPEPSFMAGSVALAAAGLLLLRHATTGLLGRLDYVALAFAVVAVLASNSGSALASVSLLLILAVWPRFSALGRGATLVGALLVAGVVSGSVLDARTNTVNWSWDDRMASILGAFRYMFAEAGTALVGVGRGNSTVLFQAGRVPLEGLQFAHYPLDIFSVTGRVVFEGGLIFGGLVFVLLIAPILFVPVFRGGIFYRLSLAALWVLVSGFTITYDAAVWIWALPGIAAGLCFRKVLMTKRLDETD